MSNMAIKSKSADLDAARDTSSWKAIFYSCCICISYIFRRHSKMVCLFTTTAVIDRTVYEYDGPITIPAY